MFYPALGTAQDFEPRAYANAPVGLNFLEHEPVNRIDDYK